ncbi:permease prefix domain 1-containing protein [Micromonospora sp. DT53]|uniref:permease prefix domain 1-containing protein n=1 Tax=Micromonospora sp. DT53 TaxID=3393444 RepID=UPI003CF23484
MTAHDRPEELEAQFAQWRQYVLRRRELQAVDADELEDHLRGSVDELVAAGLSPDEAFLVAVKRMGSLDDLSREFAREHSDRLWKQLVLTGDHRRAGAAGGHRTRDGRPPVRPGPGDYLPTKWLTLGHADAELSTNRLVENG